LHNHIIIITCDDGEQASVAEPGKSESGEWCYASLAEDSWLGGDEVSEGCAEDLRKRSALLTFRDEHVVLEVSI